MHSGGDSGAAQTVAADTVARDGRQVAQSAENNGKDEGDGDTVSWCLHRLETLFYLGNKIYATLYQQHVLTRQNVRALACA